MRALFFLFGIWHVFATMVAGALGAWWLLNSAISPWGNGLEIVGVMLVISAIITVPALGVAAQGGTGGTSKGRKSAGAALALPGFVLAMFALDWGWWYPGLWLYVVPFVPGLLLGSIAMSGKEAA